MCWQVAAVKGDYQHKQESGTFFGEQYQHMLSALASSASTWVSLPSPNTCKLMPCCKALTLVCTADRLCQTAWVRTGAGMRCLEAVGRQPSCAALPGLPLPRKPPSPVMPPVLSVKLQTWCTCTLHARTCPAF